MGLKIVNGHPYYSGSSNNPVTNRLNIYGSHGYLTQAEFIAKLKVKSLGKGLTCIKNYLKYNNRNTVVVIFEDIKEEFIFTYYRSFTYYQNELPQLKKFPSYTTKKKFVEGIIYSDKGV